MNNDWFFDEEIRRYGGMTYEKFVFSEISENWYRFIDEDIVDKIRPVTMDKGILYVDIESAAFKDQLKFSSEKIVDTINNIFGQGKPIIRKIKLASTLQEVLRVPQRRRNRRKVKVKNPETIEEVALSDEELDSLREKASKISNERLRQTVLQTLFTQARIQKFRLIKGWHKCEKCETLCPPEEMFCEVCKIRERDTMTTELFKIFYDEPWLKVNEAQKKLLEKMPHMQRECSPDTVESARTSLIQKIAGGIHLGDEESPEVMKLVMLEKRLPPEKLTPAIIRRTLIDLQFNLQPKIRRYLQNLRK